MMLKIKLVDQEFVLGGLAVSIASKRLNFKLDTLLARIGCFRIKAVCPLASGNSKELFACVENLLVVNLDVYI